MSGASANTRVLGHHVPYPSGNTAPAPRPHAGAEAGARRIASRQTGPCDDRLRALIVFGHVSKGWRVAAWCGAIRESAGAANSGWRVVTMLPCSVGASEEAHGVVRTRASAGRAGWRRGPHRTGCTIERCALRPECRVP